MQEQILGDYRVLKQIGQGTLGNVLLAEHRFIKKQYILKVLPGELAQDRIFVQRFEEDVAKLATLEHPHIVKIHNVSFADNVYFLVTDCIVDSIGETTNLAQYMSGRKERLREDELLSVMRQIASALDYAHSREVAHGALKLNNLLIGKGNPGIDVFISDFGLSNIISPGAVIGRTFKIMADALNALPVENSFKSGEERYLPFPVDTEKMSKLSQSFLQGYAFLAPEQKRFQSIGIAADAYAFGVLAYYLITGRFPEGSFDMASEVAPEYLTDWDHLVMTCLRTKVEKRPNELLPLLEKKKQTRSPAIHAYDDLEKKKQVQSPAIRPIEESVKREESSSAESLKSTLTQKSLEEEEDAFALAGPKHLEDSHEQVILQPKVKSDLKPVINRHQQDTSPVVQQGQVPPTIVEKKDISEATSLPITPREDEIYSQALNSMLNREPVVTQYQPEKKVTKHIEPLQSEMVVIQGGHLVRGSNEGNRDEMPLHKVFIESFALDIHPVTNEQFVRFLEYMGGEKDPNYNDLIRLKDSRINRLGGKLFIESGYAKHPVVGVTWYGAVAYANWVGKRLPSEAEWEIAVRGRLEHSLYPTGENIEKTQANFFSSDTTAVMSYAPNRYGLYDMVGNVYEWCQDWYGYNYYETSAQEPTNPKGPLQGVYRVLRGGCWKSLKEDLRCSHRHRNNPGTVNSTYGFRCAADVQ